MNPPHTAHPKIPFSKNWAAKNLDDNPPGPVPNRPAYGTPHMQGGTGGGREKVVRAALAPRRPAIKANWLAPKLRAVARQNLRLHCRDQADVQEQRVSNHGIESAGPGAGGIAAFA
jgi:hypothetical protein